MVRLGLILPIAAACLMGILQWNSSLSFRASRQEVFQIRSIQFGLEHYLSLIKDAETGQRGYLLTEKESYLEPYLDALKQRQTQSRALRQLVAHSTQEKNFEQLEILIDAKLRELEETVVLEEQGKHAAALEIMRSDLGRNLMEQIRLRGQSMLQLQSDLLANREASYQRHSQMNLILCGLILTMDLLCIAMIFFLLRRLGKYHEMVKICAWSKMVEYQGEWLSIEAYLKQRLHAEVTHGISSDQAAILLRTIEETKPLSV